MANDTLTLHEFVKTVPGRSADSIRLVRDVAIPAYEKYAGELCGLLVAPPRSPFRTGRQPLESDRMPLDRIA